MSRGNPIPTLGRLAWHEGWAGFGEGTFTLLAKLRALNSVGKTYFVQHLGQSKELSFVTGSAARSNDLSQRIHSANVESQLGPLFAQAATDLHLRYCKTCLAGGYHAAICQLDFFDRCPIHREPLLDRCSNCDRPTPRFALLTPGAFPSFNCNHCKFPLVGKSPLGRGPDSWLVPLNLCSIEQFHAWAASVANRVELVHAQSWMTCCPNDSTNKRAALVYVLLKVDPNPSCAATPPCPVDLPFPIPIRWGLQPKHNLTYFNVASTIVPSPLQNIVFWNGWATVSDGLRVPVDPDVGVAEHATYIWRCQFEDYGTLYTGITNDGLADNRLKSFIERWSSTFLAPGSSLWDKGWRELADFFWRAALRIAQSWSAHCRRCRRINGKPTLNEAWLARLGRWDFQTGSPIGVARCTYGPESKEIYLFLA